jgi:hypothetical protein
MGDDLVGRDRELAVLTSCLHKARLGRPQTSGLPGRAGRREDPARAGFGRDRSGRRVHRWLGDHQRVPGRAAVLVLVADAAAPR